MGIKILDQAKVRRNLPCAQLPSLIEGHIGVGPNYVFEINTKLIKK